MVSRLSFITGLMALSAMFVQGASDPRPGRIQGDYLEVRTSDVWTGPCFANGEVNLVGKEALLAWRVGRGSWNGVSLDGLKVVAVVRANATLGDPYGPPLQARSVLLVDQRADAAQSQALVGLAHEMGGELLRDVVAVEPAPISMEIDTANGIASLKAGETVEMKTRALNHHDIHCGNEFEYYPPLTSASARPAFALAHRYSGSELGAQWSNPGKRSAFIGTFSTGGDEDLHTTREETSVMHAHHH